MKLQQWNTNSYIHKHSYVYNYGRELIEDWLVPQRKERILDLGCGTGQLTSAIAGITPEVIGLDSSEEMISKAKQSYPTLTFILGNAETKVFEQPFDAIFSNAALHWMLDYKNVIKTIATNLKPKGRLIVEFGGEGNVRTIRKHLEQTLLDFDFLEQSKVRPWYFPSLGTYTTLLEQAGFRVLRATHFDRPTELKDTKHGIRNWLMMFGNPYFAGIPLDIQKEICTNVEDKCKPVCYREGRWYADYVRLRIEARKVN